MTEEEWLKQLFAGLSKSSFRSRFHLKEQDKEYVRQKGLDKIQEHAQDFIEKGACPGFYRKEAGSISDPKRWKADSHEGPSGFYRPACYGDLLQRMSGKMA